MLYLVPMYRASSPLSISSKINTKHFQETSLWGHFTKKNGEKPKNMAKFVFNHTILGTSDFRRVCGKSFLEWKNEHFF